MVVLSNSGQKAYGIKEYLFTNMTEYSSFLTTVDFESCRPGCIFSIPSETLQYVKLSDGSVVQWPFTSGGGGSGGTTNYNELTNKPQINNVELVSNKTSTDLGLADASTVTTLETNVTNLTEEVNNLSEEVTNLSEEVTTISENVANLEGGTTGQILTKASDNDYDFVWVDETLTVSSIFDSNEKNIAIGFDAAPEVLALKDIIDPSDFNVILVKNIEELAAVLNFGDTAVFTGEASTLWLSQPNVLTIAQKAAIKALWLPGTAYTSTVLDGLSTNSNLNAAQTNADVNVYMAMQLFNPIAMTTAAVTPVSPGTLEPGSYQFNFDEPSSKVIKTYPAEDYVNTNVIPWWKFFSYVFENLYVRLEVTADGYLKRSDVINNLGSTAEDLPLSANMGRELNDITIKKQPAITLNDPTQTDIDALDKYLTGELIINITHITEGLFYINGFLSQHFSLTINFNDYPCLNSHWYINNIYAPVIINGLYAVNLYFEKCHSVQLNSDNALTSGIIYMNDCHMIKANCPFRPISLRQNGSTLVVTDEFRISTIGSDNWTSVTSSTVIMQDNAWFWSPDDFVPANVVMIDNTAAQWRDTFLRSRIAVSKQNAVTLTDPSQGTIDNLRDYLIGDVDIILTDAYAGDLTIDGFLGQDQQKITITRTASATGLANLTISDNTCHVEINNQYGNLEVINCSSVAVNNILSAETFLVKDSLVTVTDAEVGTLTIINSDVNLLAGMEGFFIDDIDHESSGTLRIDDNCNFSYPDTVQMPENLTIFDNRTSHDDDTYLRAFHGDGTEYVKTDGTADDIPQKVDVEATDGTNTVTVTNNGTLFKANISNPNAHHDSFLQLKYNEVQLRSNTDQYGSESVFYTEDGYTLLERKLYQPNMTDYVSQQFYLQDGLERPQYDYKVNGQPDTNVHDMAFNEDLITSFAVESGTLKAKRENPRTPGDLNVLTAGTGIDMTNGVISVTSEAMFTAFLFRDSQTTNWNVIAAGTHTDMFLYGIDTDYVIISKQTGTVQDDTYTYWIDPEDETILAYVLDEADLTVGTVYEFTPTSVWMRAKNDAYTREEVDALLSEKADKVDSATDGNFAGLDANGNLTDSGYKAADFEPADDTILKKADVIDDLEHTDTDLPLSANQGKVLKELIDDLGDDKADKVEDAVDGNFAGLDADGNLTDSGYKAADFEPADDTILKEADVVDNLTSESTTDPLSANQGRVLDEKKADKVADAVEGNFAALDEDGNLVDSGYNSESFEAADETILKEADVVDNLTSESTTDPLSANQGRVLKELIDDLSSSTDDALATKADKVEDAVDGNFAGLDANGNLTDSGYKAADFEPADETILKQADVIDNLTSTDTDKPLSANQGKVLKDSIDVIEEDVSALDDNKADKVTDAVDGNFAGLDADGNLTDSGYKAADFEPADDTILKQADVIDDLEHTDTDKPLSANQGYVLNDIEITDEEQTAMTYVRQTPEN